MQKKSSLRRTIASFLGSSVSMLKLKARNKTGKQTNAFSVKPRTLVLESLEARELLSVSHAEFADLQALHSDLNLPDSCDIIEIAAGQLSLAQLDAPTYKSSSSTASSVTVAWNPVANASGYVVEYKSANDASYTAMPETTATTLAITNLEPETTYKLRVCAVGDGANYANSAYSAVKAVKTKAAPTTVETPSNVVTTSDDVVNAYDGKISLREAVALYSAEGDTITFDSSLKGATITLSGSAIEIDKSLAIDASALWDEATNAPGVTIDAAFLSRIFDITNEAFVVEIDSLAFTRGYAPGDEGYANGDGGAVRSFHTELVVSNSEFFGNSAGRGGAIAAGPGPLTVSNSSFHDNTASFDENSGGAIYAEGCSANISNSNFHNNSGIGEWTYGGAISALGTTLTISNSDFRNNSSGWGGAIDAENSSLVIANSSFTQNTASNGSAISSSFWNDEPVFQLFNVTVSGNVSTGIPDAPDLVLGAIDGNVSELDVYNSIVVGNQNGDFAISGKYGDSDYVCNIHNVLAESNGWSGVIAYDPSLPLFTNAAAGDYTLAPGSQAINRGDNAYATSQTDLAGAPRIIGESVDLGAYEFDSVEPVQLDVPAFKSSSSTASSVTVAWNPVANASGYVVEYKSSTDSGYTAMPATTDTTIVVPNLASETTYKLRVYALGDGVNYLDSGYSAVKAVKTKVAVDPIQLDAPAFKSSSSTSSSVTVAWNPVANASGYVVEYKSSTDSSYTAAPATTDTTLTIPNLASETTYKLRVYALGDGVIYADSVYSAVKAVKTKVAVDPIQ
ncbi:MAG: fibronectin type III domain-containing protein, partial [Thermoguttaceae bacterium]|nr:fibronectin type III domain-containing protein [Thermoguttaceae bacterium]